jgi:hypothetical protein
MVPRDSFAKRQYVVIDIQKNQYRTIAFHDEYRDQVELVSFDNAGDIVFTLREGSVNDMYKGKLNGMRVVDAERITSDNAHIYSLQATPQGMVYVSDRSGTPAAYLLAGSTSIQLSDNFFGENLMLIKNASAPVASGNQQTISQLPSRSRTK